MKKHLFTRAAFGFMVMTLLFASGCGGTAVQPTQVQTPTSAFSIVPKTPLPPALVETEPQAGSQISLQGTITLYFDQSMDRTSVESAWQLQPSVSGTLKWLDDATLQFTPSSPLQPAQDLSLTIGISAKATNGLALQNPISLTYQTADYLKVLSVLPKGDTNDVDPASAVVVNFNQPVVAVGPDSEQAPAAFTIQPQTAGQGEWLNSSTYIFYPKPALEGGKQYSIQLDGSLTGTMGSGFASTEALSWSFTTAMPEVASVDPASDQKSAVDLDSSFSVTFNQPMDQENVQDHFSLTGADGSAVQGSFKWDESGTTITFIPAALLARAQVYTLKVDGVAQALGGTPLGSDFVMAYTTVPELQLVGSNPGSGAALTLYSGYGNMDLIFSAPIKENQDLSQLVTVSPTMDDLNIYSYDNHLTLSGIFQPSTHYTIELSSQLEDRWMGTLGSPTQFSFVTASASPSIEFYSTSMFVTTSDKTIPAQGVNLDSVTVTAGAMPLADFIDFLTYSGKVDGTTYTAPGSTQWTQTLQLPANQVKQADISLTQSGSPLKPGIYFYRMDSPSLDNSASYYPAWAAVVASHVHLTVKSSLDQVMVWAVDLDTNLPVANASFSIYDSSGSSIAAGVTNAQGVGTVSIPARENSYDTLIVVSGGPGSDQFGITSTGWTMTPSPWDFNINFQYQDQRPLIYLYSDRPLYQPGQTIYFKGVVRQADNGRYSLANLQTVTVDLVGPIPGGAAYSEGTLQTFTVPVSDYGTFNAEYQLPDTAVAGIYSLSVEDNPNTYLNFTVEQYRKPEIDLSVTASARDVVAGQDLHAKVSANYYFGAPAGDQPVQWTLSAASGYFPMSGGYQTGKQQWYGVTMTGAENYYSSGTTIASGEGTTAADGTLDLSIPASDFGGKLDAEQMQTLTLEVTMQDQSNLAVSARDTIDLNPASYYIGVLPETWSVPAGTEIGFSILTVDWTGAVSGNHALVASFGQYDLVQTSTDPMTGTPTYTPKITPVSSTNFQTDSSGRARVSFTPPHAGTYLLGVRGSDGAVTQWLVWVGGAGTASWSALPDQRLELVADAKQYQAGQTAHVLIPNPLNDGALALITVERAKVMSSRVVTLSGSSYDLALPLTEDDAPNVYVSVTIIGRNSDDISDYRQGYVQLNVTPTQETLNVQLTASPQTGEPGGQETFTVKVTNSSGKPVQGEFSLALVDKALLALADANSAPILQAFYGTQPLGVQTNLALAEYASRLVPPLPGLGGGGQGGGPEAGTLRTNFQDTAYWNATIVTDVNGMATVTFSLPDNLTTWVATLRGLTRDTQVGEATTELVTSKQLLVRPETPDFLVAGDHVKLSAIVQNNTSQSLSVDVSLAVKGVTLDTPDQEGQHVQVPANDQQAIAWWAKVDDVSSARLVFSASSGDLQDVTTPAIGDIPVLHYTVPQTYGTSGVLTDAGSSLELFSLPRFYKATGGELDLELSPSLAATVFSGMQALEAGSDDFTEPVLSRMQPDVAMLQALNDLSIDNPDLKNKLETNIALAVDHLSATQNSDGGWGWSGTASSDDYLTADVLFGIYQATQAGFQYDPGRLNDAVNYLQATLFTPTIDTEGWQLDRLAFKTFVLATMGNYSPVADTLYDLRTNLSPWGRALLALTENLSSANSDKVQTLVSDLEASGTASAAGISWPDAQPSWQNLDSAYFSTAVVTYALAQLDPASPQLANAVRYLVMNRQETGMWSSTFDTAWVLMALTQDLRGTGELQADFSYSATLNDAPFAKGQAGGNVDALTSVTASVPANELIQDSSNALLIQRGDGNGKLYYQAYLSVDKPAKDAQPLSAGVTVTRDYYLAGQNCQQEVCKPISSAQLANPEPEVLVRVTVTVPKEMYYLVVDDNIPAGAEIVNETLNTSQQNQEPAATPAPQYDPSNPYSDGWGWWYFSQPQYYASHIRWIANDVPAGTYVLTYKIQPFAAGEFQVLPAHAWMYYFPDVEGTSAGTTFTITENK